MTPKVNGKFTLILVAIICGEATWNLHQLQAVREDVSALKVQVGILLQKEGLANGPQFLDRKLDSGRGEGSLVLAGYQSTRYPSPPPNPSDKLRNPTCKCTFCTRGGCGGCSRLASTNPNRTQSHNLPSPRVGESCCWR